MNNWTKLQTDVTELFMTQIILYFKGIHFSFLPCNWKIICIQSVHLTYFDKILNNFLSNIRAAGWISKLCSWAVAGILTRRIFIGFPTFPLHLRSAGRTLLSVCDAACSGISWFFCLTNWQNSVTVPSIFWYFRRHLRFYNSFCSVFVSKS